MSESYFKYSADLKDKVFRFAVRLLGNYESAQDIVQDVFEKLWIKQDELHKYKNMEVLSIKITKDLCLDRLRYQKMKWEKLKNKVYDEKFSSNNTNYDENELVEIIKHLITKLPEKQKMVIHLRDVEGFEFDEIKEILEMDINAIRMNLSRARKTIREQIVKIMNYGLQ